MKFNYLHIFILLLFIYNNNIINSQIINDEEGACLLSLGTAFGDTQYSEDKIPTICQTVPSLCDSEGHILSLVLKSSTSSTLYVNNISCFQSLEKLILNEFSLEDDFIYNSNIRSLEFFNCNPLDIYKELPLSLESLTLMPPYASTTEISYFKNLKSLNYKSGHLSGYLDLISSNTSFVGNAETIQLFSNIFPDLSSFPKLSGFFLSDTPNETQLKNNIFTYNKIKVLDFVFKKGSIPVELTQMFNPQYQTLRISVSAYPQFDQLLDFSNKKEVDIDEFTVNFVYNYTGVIPIKRLPLVKINKLSIHNAKITNTFNYSIFENVTTISFNNLNLYDRLPSASVFKSARYIIFPFNNFYGTIDESWCYVNFQLYKNNLSGIPPDCIRCYLSDPNILGKLTPNPDLNMTVSCSEDKITPNIKLDSENSYIYLFGKNLGFYSENIITIPKIIFEEPIIYSSLYRGQFENYADAIGYDTLNVYFVYPGYNYTLSINQSIGPNVTSLTQNNNLITIDGSFFSYNLTDIQITIGEGNNTFNCIVIGSTFYQIRCSIIQIDKSEIKKVTIKVSTLSIIISSLINKVVYECSPSDCNGNGLCNQDNGICECNKGWLSKDGYICQVANHYLYSNTQVLSTTGGLIQLYGWFGNLHNQLNVAIGNQICNITLVEDSLIECNIKAGSGMKSIKIIQNNIEWSGSIYPYYDPIYICPNNCGGPSKGKCNSSTGECKCESGFIGFDCQSRNTSSSSNTTVSDNGTVIVSDQYFDFLLSIDSIIEYDLNLNAVVIANLTNKWNRVNTDENSTITLFSQIANGANIILTIEEVKTNPKQFSFAGSTFIVSAGGIKISVNISNWNYSSSLNYLQLSLSSTLDDKNNQENNNSDCKEQTVIESSSSIKSLQDNVNYLKISKYGYSLYGKFQPRMLSNQKPTLITTKIKSQNNTNVILTIDIPHCSECILDPDFSILINPDSKVQICKDKKKWLLPVVIIIPVVFVTIIIASIIYYFKNKKEKELKIKLSKLKNKV